MELIFFSNKSIWPIDRTLSGATTPGQRGPGSMAMKEYSALPKAQLLLKPHHQIVDCHRTLVGGVLPLCRDAVGVFCSLSRLGQHDTCWGSLTPLQRCSRCILQSQPIGPTRHSLGESYPSAEMQSVYSAVSADWANTTLVGGVLPLCRDAVGVFCSLSRLGQHDTHWGSLTPLQRCSRCILQSQPIGPTGHSLGESYPSAEMQSVYSTAPADLAVELPEEFYIV